MTNHDYFKLLNEQLIEILHDLLATGNWNATLFLRTAQKKLQDLHDEAMALSHEYEEDLVPKEVVRKEGLITVYVSLYLADPFNITKWENTLKTIKEQSINRPIYRSEEHIQEMIRSKAGSPKEGYVSIYIDPNDIIAPYSGKIVEDKWGHELLTLRDNSLVPSNIIEFVHQGNRYSFKNGKLIQKSTS